MSILIDAEIIEEIYKGIIVIKPFDHKAVGTNSYDVHLGKTLAVYKDRILDAKLHNQIEYIEIPEEGLVLEPQKLYLGATVEYTETHQHVPFIESKSSTARLGVMTHQTAGRGDVGFKGHWTLEISCLQPVRIYAGMPISQLFYFRVNHEKIQNPYNNKKSAKYTEITPLPVESMMFKNFLLDKEN